jgi:hypothetical protein
MASNAGRTLSGALRVHFLGNTALVFGHTPGMLVGDHLEISQV